jgi:hypothetical protein
MVDLREIARLGKEVNEYEETVKHSIAVLGANRHRIELLTVTGTQFLELYNGFTVDWYKRLAPFVKEDERELLAVGCLQHHSGIEVPEFSNFDGFCFQNGINLGERIVEVLEDGDFDQFVLDFKQEHAAYKEEFPITPRWFRNENGQFVLKYNGNEWSYTNAAYTIISLINALHQNDWTPVERIQVWYSPTSRESRMNPPPVEFLTSEQVKQAVNQLKKRTTGHIEWHSYQAEGASWEPVRMT